jgi:hypothetical protein
MLPSLLPLPLLSLSLLPVVSAGSPVPVVSGRLRASGLLRVSGDAAGGLAGGLLGLEAGAEAGLGTSEGLVVVAVGGAAGDGEAAVGDGAGVTVL